MIREIVLFLEEPSAKAMLDEFLPRILPPEVSHHCIVFQGKQDLEKNIVDRLRHHNRPDTGYVVVRDQDREDCREVKKRLAEFCKTAGKPDTLVRVACHELESWYLADLAAVEAALEVPRISRLQNKRHFREPDRLQSPALALKRLTKERYYKVEGSRRIGRLLDPGNPRSVSFRHFVTGLLRLVGHAGGAELEGAPEK